MRSCLVYIGLNMVLAGAVSHPAERDQGGSHEIQGELRRNRLLVLDVLAEAVGVSGRDELASAHQEWIEAALTSNQKQREEVWRKSIAVGSAAFVQKTKELLGLRAKGRKVAMAGDTFMLTFMLREAQELYEPISPLKIGP